MEQSEKNDGKEENGAGRDGIGGYREFGTTGTAAAEGGQSDNFRKPYEIVLLHLDGIPSLRGTLRRAQTDIAYRWFLGYTLNEELPHFSTVSHNFRHRFTEKTTERVFQWVLNEAGTAGALPPAEKSRLQNGDEKHNRPGL